LKENHKSKLLTEVKQLIRLRSVTTNSNRAIAFYIGSLMKRAKLRVHYQKENIGGTTFYNVVGKKGRGKAPLILMTHLDTVPPGPHTLWTKTGGDPWRATPQGPRIYGLGSADTKLDILSKIFAASMIDERAMKAPLWIIGTFGEERGLLGAKTFCRKVKRAKGVAFVSEPTELQWVYEHNGYLVLEVTFAIPPRRNRKPDLKMFALKVRGKSAHSSRPKEGRNAIRLGFEFLEKLSRKDPLLTLLSVQGGSSPNQVPSEALFTIGTSLKGVPRHPYIEVKKQKKRFKGEKELPWTALVALFRSVDRGIDRWRHPMTSNVGVIQEKKGFLHVCVDFRIHPKDTNRKILQFFKARMKKVLLPYHIHPSFKIERDGMSLSVSRNHPILHLARWVSRKSNLPFRLLKKPTCTEAGFLWEKGIPALVFGSGRAQGNIHAPNEFNDLRQIEKARCVYHELIKAYCLTQREEK